MNRANTTATVSPSKCLSKLADQNLTSKGVVVPLYNSKEEMEEALDSTDHLRNWNFRGSKCDRCGIPNSQVSGLLLQCGLCKNAYYCSRACFNEDLEDHQQHCESSIMKHQPVAGPELRRRGDDDYEETEEQRECIKRKEEKIAKLRAEKKPEPKREPVSSQRRKKASELGLGRRVRT